MKPSDFLSTRGRSPLSSGADGGGGDTRVRPRALWNLFDTEVLKWHAEVGLEPDFFVHLAEIRMVLEPEAAAYAALRSTPDDLREMSDWLERMGQKGIGREAFAQADLEFHLAVARAAHNPRAR